VPETSANGPVGVGTGAIVVVMIVAWPHPKQAASAAMMATAGTRRAPRERGERVRRASSGSHNPSPPVGRGFIARIMMWQAEEGCHKI
jgi:hypothetical protein